MLYPNILIKTGFSDPVIVPAIKKQLIALGIGAFDITNYNYGVNTAASVKLFQERNQLFADGIIGELTWNRLFNGKPAELINSLYLPERAYQIIHTQLFVREKTGMNDGYEVEQYLHAVGLGKGYAWCQALQFWAFQKAADQLAVYNPMPKVAGVLKHRDIVRARGSMGPGKVLRKSEVRKYDLGVMDYHKNYEGHIFMVKEVKGDKIYTIEGNTNSEGGREGNGVFERIRLISTLDCVIRY